MRATVTLVLALLSARCGRATGPAISRADPAALKVGIGGLPLQAPERGVQQFVSNITLEGLLRVDHQGRPDPWLAESWKVAPDGLRLSVRLRQKATFHDGSRVDATTVAAILQKELPSVLGSNFKDVESITAEGDDEITFRFRRPSSFVVEALVDVPIRKAGTPTVGTGPFMSLAAAASPDEAARMNANDRYYLGRPLIDQIVVRSYPKVRAAWADLLRSQVDMLYEVDFDALDLMQGNTRIALYEFERPYQYLVVLNPNIPKLRSKEIRRALNQAIDRAAILREGLANHGTVSAGPVSPHHWAFRQTPSTFRYDPALASSLVRKALSSGAQSSGREAMTLRCLTPAAAPYDRLALLVKQQLAAVGVELEIEEADSERLGNALNSHDFEAMLIDALSGWNMFRPSRWWHSNGSRNVGFSNKSVDSALDEIQHATSDEQYRAGVIRFEDSIAEDPPAIFLAWGGRSRAVSRSFEVQSGDGLDVLATVRMWKPTTSDKSSQN